MAVLIRGASPSASDEQVDRHVRLRRARQNRLTGASPPPLWTIMDEVALRRPIGATDVFRDQRRHLVRRAERPNITLQVLPVRQGLAQRPRLRAARPCKPSFARARRTRRVSADRPCDHASIGRVWYPAGTQRGSTPRRFRPVAGDLPRLESSCSTGASGYLRSSPLGSGSGSIPATSITMRNNALMRAKATNSVEILTRPGRRRDHAPALGLRV